MTPDVLTPLTVLCFVVAAALVGVVVIVVVRRARAWADLCAWLSEQDLTLEAVRAGWFEDPPFEFEVSGGRALFRFEASEPSGRKCSGWACAGHLERCDSAFPAVDVIWDHERSPAPAQADGTAFRRTLLRVASGSCNCRELARSCASGRPSPPPPDCGDLVRSVRRLRESGHRRRTA